MSRVSSLIVLVLAIFALIALFSNPTNVVAAAARHHRYLTHDDDTTVENFDQEAEAEEEDREESCGYYWANSLNGYMTSCNVVSSDHGNDCYRYCPSVFSACQWICPNSMSDLSAEEELLLKMKKRAMDKKKALIVKLRKQWQSNKKKLLTQLSKKKAALKKKINL